MEGTKTAHVEDFVPDTRPIATNPNSSKQTIKEDQSKAQKVSLHNRIKNLFEYRHMRELSNHDYYMITTLHKEALDRLERLDNHPRYSTDGKFVFLF